MRFVYSPSFVRSLKKLVKRQPELDEDIRLAPSLLSKDHFHPSLSTHKLKGQRGHWEQKILLLAIGTHDQVY